MSGCSEAWAKALAVLLTAHQRVIRAALPYLRQSKSPRIVNIASTEALGATALHSPYSAAKAGVVGLTRSLAVELGRDGITVNCICPGPIATAMTARISDEHKAVYARRRTALGRYGDPEEVAHMTLSLPAPPGDLVPDRRHHPGGRRPDGAECVMVPSAVHGRTWTKIAKTTPCKVEADPGSQHSCCTASGARGMRLMALTSSRPGVVFRPNEPG